MNQQEVHLPWIFFDSSNTEKLATFNSSILQSCFSYWQEQICLPITSRNIKLHKQQTYACIHYTNSACRCNSTRKCTIKEWCNATIYITCSHGVHFCGGSEEHEAMTVSWDDGSERRSWSSWSVCHGDHGAPPSLHAVPSPWPCRQHHYPWQCCLFFWYQTLKKVVIINQKAQILLEHYCPNTPVMCKGAGHWSQTNCEHQTSTSTSSSHIIISTIVIKQTNIILRFLTLQ